MTDACQIGKASSLDVNKVVAVSKKGFTETAINKASACGIDTVSLEGATDEELESHFIRPGLALVSDEALVLTDILYLKENDYRSLREIGLEAEVEYNGEVIGTVGDVFGDVFQRMIAPQIREYLNQNRLETFKTFGDLSKTMQAERILPLSDVSVLINHSHKQPIEQVKFLVQGTRRVANVEQNHSMFNEKMISTGEHVDGDGMILKSKILQDPESGKLHVNFQKKPPE